MLRFLAFVCMEELTEVQLARVLADRREAFSDFGFAESVLISQLTLDLLTQGLARSRQVT